MLVFIRQILPLCWFYVINVTSLDAELGETQSAFTLACQEQDRSQSRKSRTSFLELLYPDHWGEKPCHLEWWFGITSTAGPCCKSEVWEIVICSLCDVTSSWELGRSTLRLCRNSFNFFHSEKYFWEINQGNIWVVSSLGLWTLWSSPFVDICSYFS